ncbi:hypothetical protein DENSPDRAFT_854376 [Dentipellis sp. KUC8613]|nr:hypothetical protein DENSPDRAFT_854376 [Dentipellis sp. KUC8613]
MLTPTAPTAPSLASPQTPKAPTGAFPTPSPAPASTPAADTDIPPPPSISIPTLNASPAAHPRPTSLASSRPAPPSPAASRRASAALSRASSTRSRPSSTQSPAPRRASALSVPDSPSLPDTPTPGATQRGGTGGGGIFVKIRDFAYPAQDERHAGRGADAPRPNKRLQRPLSAWSSASSSSAASEDDDDDERRGSGWGGFKWGGLSGWFGAHRGDGGGGGGGAGGGGGPSQGDFERNFAETPEEERADPYAQWEQYSDDEYEEEGAGADSEGVGAGPLLPGLYRAMFAFEPEGTAEMRLEEDQIVRVVGRGGGVGWAIVERSFEEAREFGAHALVPEGYLEVHRLDEPED